VTGRPDPGPVVPPPGAHGGDAEALARVLGVEPCDVLDLSVTMNPLASDIAPLVARHACDIRRYPQPSRATRALSEALGVPSERLLLTNGGAEAIALVARELRVASLVEPEFSLWRRHLVTVRSGAEARERDRVRSNPNNPTGVLAPEGARAACWDEAFYALATGHLTRGDAERGALVVGSFTKLFACPGLRLGYVIAPDARLLEMIRARQPEWSVSSIALGVLPELLDGAPLVAWAREVASLRGSLVSVLERAGFAVDAADAPWVLVREAAWLRPALGRLGILVRDCTSFGLPGTVRIAVPSPGPLERLARGLELVVEDQR